MSSNSNVNKKRKKRKKFFKYFMVSFLIFFTMVALAYGVTYNGQKDNNADNLGVGSSSGDNTSDNKTSLLDSIFGPKQIKTNIAIFGTDKDGLRTDVIFVVTFDSKTKKIGLLSVPRDTRVTMTDDMVKELKEKNKRGPSSYICKINEVHAYAPKDERNKFSVMQLEDLLKIKINYYAKIDLEAFRVIVDAFDGVDIDVPRDMYYSDPYQDLYINLKKGMQHLDGKKAEQLVRFRRYPTGDEARIEVQQLFMTEFMKKILNTKELIGNIPTIINTIYKYVETDIGIDDALRYVKYINDIKPENVTMEVLPGSPETINEISYFLCDTTETRILVDKLFYNTEVAKENTTTITDTSESETISSKNKNIEILNGGSIGGIAGRTKEKLEKEGFTVTSIGTYEGTRKEETIIIVEQEGMGEDLKKYFLDSNIEVDSEKLSNDTSIKIIIGTKEK